MRRAGPLLLLTGGLLVLASLYLPWQQTSRDSGHSLAGEGGTVSGLLNRFATEAVDGWSSAVGEATALFAAALAALAAIALARPTLAARLPLGQCALLTGYFTIAVGAETRSVADQQETSLGGVDLNYTYGAYLGVATAILVLLTAGAMRRNEFAAYHSASRLVAAAVSIGFLVALLLPWARYPPTRLTVLGIALPAAMVAAAFAIRLPVVWSRTDSAAGVERLVISGAAALFTAAGVTSLTFPGRHAYSAWLALGFACGLVALALTDSTGPSTRARPSLHAVSTSVASALFVSSLFLPWQNACYPMGAELGRYSGRCVATNGWGTTVGSAAALLAIAFAAATLAPRRVRVPVVEFAAGLGLLVVTLRFQLVEGANSLVRFEFGYGSTLGFSAATLVTVLAVVRLHPPRVDVSRLRVRLVPIAACVAYLAAIVVPWWDVLPRALPSASLFAPPSWLTIAAMLLAIRLLRLWLRRIGGATGSAEELVLLPLALLALAAVDLVRVGDDGMTWGGGVVVGLCLLLALFGRLEQREGLDNLRIPAILRFERL